MDYIISHAVSILVDLLIVAVVHFIWSKKKNRLNFDIVTAICIVLLIIFGIYMPLHSAHEHHMYTNTILFIVYALLSLVVGLTTFMKFKFLHHEHECMEVEMTECIIRNKRANLVLGKGLHSVILFCKAFTIFMLIGNLIIVLVK